MEEPHSSDWSAKTAQSLRALREQADQTLSTHRETVGRIEEELSLRDGFRCTGVFCGEGGGGWLPERSRIWGEKCWEHFARLFEALCGVRNGMANE